MPNIEATHEFTCLFPFCGLGAGARGFLQAIGRLGKDEARFRSLGGIDNDPLACRDFEYLTGSPALCGDLNEVTPEQLRAFAGSRRPDAVFCSPPCKGFSKLLSKDYALTERYQRLNRLVLQGLFLVLETWKDDPPPALLFENVPGIETRGAQLLHEVHQLLAAYGYVWHEGTHNCGEVGGLRQNRVRFLMVARKAKAIPAFIFRPPRLRVKGCGEILETLPMPDDAEAGNLHELPRISWLNWVRLALIPASGDWRDLPASIPEVLLAQTAAGAGTFKGRPGLMAVNAWDKPVPSVIGRAQVSGSNGTAAVADPRVPKEWRNPVKKGQQRRAVFCRWHVAGWKDPARTVAGPGMNGGYGVADPRIERGNRDRSRGGAMGVIAWDKPAPTVTGSMQPARSNTPASVADPRLKCAPRAGAYGVLSWQQAAATVTGAARIDNGTFAVADPRKCPPKGKVPVIVAEDGTWHRPLTTLELAALQGLPARVNGAPLKLATMESIGRKGESAPSSCRERIGNAVPVGTARAIGESILTALLAASLGTWMLSPEAIWVRNDGDDENTANAPWLPQDLAREEARFQQEAW